MDSGLPIPDYAISNVIFTGPEPAISRIASMPFPSILPNETWQKECPAS